MMLKDLSEENILIKLCKETKNTCLTKSLIKMENLTFKLNTEEK